MANTKQGMQEMEVMTARKVATYLTERISTDTSDIICRRCMDENKGQCLMDLKNLEDCPKILFARVLEEAQRRIKSSGISNEMLTSMMAIPQFR